MYIYIFYYVYIYIGEMMIPKVGQILQSDELKVWNMEIPFGNLTLCY